MPKTIKRIDFHTHILPPELPDLGKRYGGERWPSIVRVNEQTAHIMVQGNVFRKIGSDTWDPAKKIERMQLDGVDMQVLSPIPIGLCYWAPVEGAREMARLQNEYNADLVRQHPTRFIGLGTVPLQNAEAAIEEMDYCMHKLGLKGIEIGSNVNGLGLEDPALSPFFEMAERWNVPLFIHPYDMVAKERTAKAGLTYTVAMPLELGLSAANFIMSGMFEKFPKLKVCLAHGGGALPFILPRMEQGWHVFPDTRKTPYPPSHYAKHFYYDVLVYDSMNVDYLNRLVGHERLLMGTDYPFAIQETPPGKSVLETESLTEEQKTAIMGGNAMEFLQIS
ncbi:amidohydrolase family protein [Ammoniphilus sp. YIM 78166]|uniref:amidohydrolase family protein n=1 Tax=Ammoniphilus sp. YIM 78166 TaxID=1644106 RepID=UPI00106FD323|nr:amidohydrolase family protein [Ammoniphilus sp. YIM 78166]